MAGNPKARARREARQLPAIRPPFIPDTDWRKMSDTEKIVACFGGSLDCIRDLLSIPFAEADMHERTLQVRVYEVTLKFAGRIGAERYRDKARAEILDQLKGMFSPNSSIAEDAER